MPQNTSKCASISKHSTLDGKQRVKMHEKLQFMRRRTHFRVTLENNLGSKVHSNQSIFDRDVKMRIIILHLQKKNNIQANKFANA